MGPTHGEVVEVDVDVTLGAGREAPWLEHRWRAASGRHGVSDLGGVDELFEALDVPASHDEVGATRTSMSLPVALLVAV